MKKIFLILTSCFCFIASAGTLVNISDDTVFAGSSNVPPSVFADEGNVVFIASGDAIYEYSSDSLTQINISKSPEDVIVFDHELGRFTLYADLTNLPFVGTTKALYYFTGTTFGSDFVSGISLGRTIYWMQANGDDKNIFVTVGAENGLFMIKFKFEEGGWLQDMVTQISTTSFAFGSSSFVSPDGSLVFYQTGGEIYKYDVAMDESVKIVDGNSLSVSKNFNQHFYVDGSNLYKVSHGEELYPKLIAANISFSSVPACSENGRFFAFSSSDIYGDATEVYGDSNAYLMDTVSGAVKCLSKVETETVYDARRISISESGEYVVFYAKLSEFAPFSSVLRYELDWDADFAAGRVISTGFDSTEIVGAKGICTSADGSRTLFIKKTPLGGDEVPILANNLTGVSYDLGIGTKLNRYKLSDSGDVILEATTSGLNYYTVNADFSLNPAVVVSASSVKQFAMDENGKNVVFLKEKNLYHWKPEFAATNPVTDPTLITDGFADLDILSPIAVSANGNFVVTKKDLGGLAIFGIDRKGNEFVVQPDALSGVTTFTSPSVSRNGRILVYEDQSGINIYDFFINDFISDSELSGASHPFVSASGAEVTFVKDNVLKSFLLRAVENKVKDIVTVPGEDVIGFSNITPIGSSITYVANSDALEGRDGEFDLYQFYSPRKNDPPKASIEPTSMEVDMLHRLNVIESFSDEYDMDMDVFTGAENGHFYYVPYAEIKESFYQSARDFIGEETVSILVVDSSGESAEDSFKLTVLKSTLNFADGYIPDDPTGDGYDVALSLSSDLITDLDLRNGDATIVLPDPDFSDLRLSDDGSQIIVENVTALGYEDVTFSVDGVSQTVRLEYGRDFTVRTGWNMLGVPYEFTESGFYALEQELEAGWGWNGVSYISCIDEQSERLKDIEKGSAYWLFHILPDGVYENGENAISLAPNKPAAYVSDLNSAENSNFFKVPLLEDKWRMISPVGYDEATTRRVSGAPVWGWDSENNVYNIPENNGGWEMHSLNGYWQFGFDGFSVKDVDEHGKAEVELKYDKSAE